jgi:predicted RND superfamily exporter protein
LARHRPFFSRYSYAIVAITALITPFLVHGAQLALQSNENKVLDWLPTSFSETADLKWFRQHFQADGFVVISWEGCRLGGNPRNDNAPPDDPRIEQLAQSLVPDLDADHESDRPADESPESRYFRSITTGRRLLNRLTEPPMEIPYELAVERLQGVVIGPDGRQTCVVAMLSKEGLDHFREAIGRGNQGRLQIGQPEGVLFRKLRACGIDPETVHLGGPPVDNVAIDEEGERTLVRLGVLAGLVGLVLAGWSLRSVRLTAIVFACGLLSAAASLAVVWLSGQTTDAILMSMPALVYVLAISGAVHLVNYYRRELEEGGLVGAPGRAMAHGWKPAVLCSVTTSIGLLSLYASELTPIRKFGTFSAIGVMLMLAVLFTFLPAALQLWPLRPKRQRSARQERAAEAVRGVWTRTTGWTRSISFDWLWDRLGHWIIRHHAIVTIASFATIVAVGVGVVRTQTTIDLMKLFDRDARILKDYRWLEQNLGRLVPLEVVLKFDESIMRDADADDPASRVGTLTLLERMELVSALQRDISREFGPHGRDMIGPPMSAVTFAPPLTGPRQGTRAIVRRTATNSRLQQNYDEFIESGYLSVDRSSGMELWRISLRVAAFQNIDYGRFSNDLREVVDPLIAKYNQRLEADMAVASNAAAAGGEEGPALSAVYTGVVPIVYKAQRELLDSLVEGAFWSFVSITPVLMLVVRSFSGGLVAMLPNALPVLTIFGGMGWLGWAVDIGSMMSASIALGVAVDDTIHFLTWFREGLQETGDRRRAILAAYRRCATPTMQAALISGLGLSVFALSTFMPTRQFGLLMLTILTAGAIAELIMLPALLAGPLGGVFTRVRQASPEVHKPHFSETVKYAKEP